ncbi:MAG: DUF1934 domain-containing protein [Bacillota bacterium]|nr:DUF1934 domain-containing protein [Bacillota bacterium]
MQENYLISIKGTQFFENSTDKTEVLTAGNYIHKTDNKFITYSEYNEEKPSKRLTSVIKVEGNDKVTVIRGGEVKSRLILEKGRRHQCHYNTPFGDLMVGVFADSIINELNDNGGCLKVSYSLDFNADFACRNEIEIQINEKGEH